MLNGTATTTTAFRISLHMEEIVMRRLILSNIALNIAQNLGVDYHADHGGIILLHEKERHTDTQRVDTVN